MSTSKFNIIICAEGVPPTRHAPSVAYQIYSDMNGTLSDRAFYERCREYYGYSLYTPSGSQVSFFSLEMTTDIDPEYKGVSLSEQNE